MPRLIINGKELSVDPGLTVLQACEMAGVEIPRFCYHERLSIAGNCRMCLVDIEKSPKPVASCAMPIAEGMVIHTDTPQVKKAREGVMEFLLINHPLDCPICDQGGECDLQDQAMMYGRGSSRYDENKRAVKDKYMGPLIKTQMTRCIHCTRCIRFATEVAGVEELGAFGRGEHMEVGTYIESAITSEMSGNMIDLCPVGALTSKPYAFKARNWELKKTESIDVLDAVGSNIRIDTRGLEVERILPSLNEQINEEWISDKTRFAYDGLKVQRLDQPMVRRNGLLQAASWQEALSAAGTAIRKTAGARVGAVVGEMVDAETMVVMRDLMAFLQSPHLDSRPAGLTLPLERSQYLFNTTIEGIEQADLILLVGANPRQEATVLNSRIKKRSRKGGLVVGVVGSVPDQTYPLIDLGNDPRVLDQLLAGSHSFAKHMKQAKAPIVIIGESMLVREDAGILLTRVHEIAEKFGMVRENWLGVNVLHRAASRVAGLDLGILPGKKGLHTLAQLESAKAGKLDVLILVGADELPFYDFGDCFVIYLGHHGDRGAHTAHVILPGVAYTEKNATYLNLEGRMQQTRLATFAPGQAREDWRVLFALAAEIGLQLPYATLPLLRQHMLSLAPHWRLEEVVPALWQPYRESGQIYPNHLQALIPYYYLTDPICRASKTMLQCTREIQGLQKDAA